MINGNKYSFKRMKKYLAVLCSLAVAAGNCINGVTYAVPGDAITLVTADSFGEIISGGFYTLSAVNSEKYITANSEGNVNQWEALQDNSQKWQIIKTGNGYCRIVSQKYPDMALTVENADSTNGNIIKLSEYDNLASQHFKLNRTGDAYYITAECSGNAALDVYGQSSENGAQIDQWDYWGGANQKFCISPAGSGYITSFGDLNGDGKTDIADRILMQSGCLNGFDEKAAALADFNGDGKNDCEDILVMNDYFFGKTGTEKSIFKTDTEENAFLFAYFLGNSPEQERLSYAVSTDGYNFKALNNGEAVWKSDVGTECIRDPYIFRCEDGSYRMLATDMKSSLGWSSNRNIISAKSYDLINWTDVTLIEVANKYPSMMGSDRAWAPQAIYVPEKDTYMIYWANHSDETGNRTIMYYAYSHDLKKFDTDPALLFAPENGDSAIDSDIIFKNGKYYMYYKNETNKRIYLATSSNAAGPYSEIKQISEGTMGVEGPNIYNIPGTDRWLLMSDAYGDGYYVMQETDDLENFRLLGRNEYSFNFTPRHGYVIPISMEQYKNLLDAYPSDSISPFCTGTEEIVINSELNSVVNLPDKVVAGYSDGSSAEFSVKWNDDDISAIDTCKKGTYTVSGNIQPVSYSEPFITERADPFITDGDDGYYYFTASYPAFGNADNGYDRIILRRSNTVSGLADAEEKTIWMAHSGGIMSKHIWAPEMHRINNIWYMFFAAGSSENVWAIRPYVLKCSGDPYTGTWTECGQMKAAPGDTESFAGFSLDMTYFENNGKHYVIWAEIKGDSSIFMAEINPDEPYQLISKPVMLTRPEYSWEKVNNRVNEGASVIKTDSKVYVFFSASGTGSEYCVGRLEADINSNLMNPSSWRKLSSPVLATSDLNGPSGPGHNSFVTDENGDILIVYHARPVSHADKKCGTYCDNPLYDPCRHTMIKKVHFDRNGVPVINMSSQSVLASKYRTVTAVLKVE